MVNIPTGILETTIALITGAIFTLVGILYRKLRNRLKKLEENVKEIEERMIEIRRDLDVAHTWMFGRDEDPSNNGISAQIEDLDGEVDDIVDALHDEDAIEIDRNDIDD